MNAMKTFVALLGAAAFSLGTANADQIDGDIDFAGQAFFNTTSLATATQVANFRSADGTNGAADVTEATGDFATMVSMGDLATFPNVYQFNPSAPAAPLWTVGGFSFDLTSSAIMFQTSQLLIIEGTGVLTGNGFDPTPGVWLLTSQQADGSNQLSFSFSANTAATPGVPDGGSTVALLGAALLGVGALRRKLVRS